MPTNARFFLAAVGATLLLTGCETTGMKLGNFEAKTPTTGSAAGSATSGESAEVEKCAGPLGTISLVENQDAGWYTVLRNEYRLPPTSNLLRLLVQQSNCFVVVERGAAGTRAMSREREIMQSGEMRGGSNFGKGQVVASDYGLSPEILFSNSNASGMGGMLGALIGGRDGRAVANFTGNIQTKEASAMLTLVDNRSGVQVAASEGSAERPVWLEVIVAEDDYLADLPARIEALAEGWPVEVLRIRRQRGTASAQMDESCETLDELSPHEVFARRLAPEDLPDDLRQALTERYARVVSRLEGDA